MKKKNAVAANWVPARVPEEREIFAEFSRSRNPGVLVAVFVLALVAIVPATFGIVWIMGGWLDWSRSTMLQVWALTSGGAAVYALIWALNRAFDETHTSG